MALKPRAGVTYDSANKTVNVDNTARENDQDDILTPEQIAKMNKDGYAVNTTRYGSKIDSFTGKPEKVTTNSPIVTTSGVRGEAQDNANFIDSNVNGGKKIVSTQVSNGVTTTTYSDGTTTKTDGGSIGVGDPDRTKILNSQQDIYNEQTQLGADIAKKYDQLQSNSDDAYNQLMVNTKNQFSSLRVKLEDSNRRFLMRTTQGQYLNNGFRYTPQQSEGLVYDAEQAGLARLADLNQKEAQALQMALQAKNADDYKALAQYTSDVRNIQADRLTTLDKMNTQIKTIEDTDKNMRNMNANESSIMNSMISAYAVTAKEMNAKETEIYYDQKAKELSEVMGFDIPKAIIKSSVEGYAEGKAEKDRIDNLTVSKDLSTANKYYTNINGTPITGDDGKNIPYAQEDWLSQLVGDTMNIGTYDEDGNRVIKSYKLAGAPPPKETSYEDTVGNLPPTQVNQVVVSLSQLYKGPNAQFFVAPEGSFLKTTNKAYEGIGNGGMQCAEFVNRVTGTTFASGKAAAVDSPGTLQVGSVASWMPQGAGEYGHAGIIVGEEGGNWIIKSVNLRGNGIVSIDSVPKSAIKGGYTPDAIKNANLSDSYGNNTLTGKYDPLQDSNLTAVGSSAEGGLFYDNTTKQTITGTQAEATYGQKAQAGATYGNTGGNGGYGTEEQIFDAIFQGSGGASKVSGDEAKLMKDRAKTFAGMGLTANEALLKYKGLNLNDPSKSGVALDYVSIGDNLDKFRPGNYEITIAKYINANDMAGLNTYVNNKVDAYVSSLYKGDAILSGDFKTGQDRTKKIVDLINNNQDKIGAFDGRASDLLQKFKGDAEYQTIKTILQMSQADMRKYFAGSAVTDTEMKALEDFIGGTTKMNSKNLVTMLTALQNDRQGVYNNQRPGMIPGATNTYSGGGNPSTGGSAPAITEGNWFDN